MYIYIPWIDCWPDHVGPYSGTHWAYVDVTRTDGTLTITIQVRGLPCIDQVTIGQILELERQ